MHLLNQSLLHLVQQRLIILHLWGTKLPEGRNGLCTTNIEHSSVIEVAKHQMKNGRLVRLVPCGKNGIVDPNMIRRATEDGKIGMVSVMYANNEIGTIQPIKEISKICKERGILLHVDCCQTFAKLPISINDVDLISLRHIKYMVQKVLAR
jgi:cysteine desulfurase